DPRYPATLRGIAQAPAALFYLGDADVLAQPQLAIVGARSATPQGVEDARAFAADLAGRGMVIGSGLALGIDAAAHRGALEAGGYTVAVCATGLDRVYPARHRELAHRIAASGVLISEFPPGVQAIAANFPKRNRLISGLALGVLVVEAALESGSLITARLAVEQGREVFAIPGSIHNPMARGCHALIRQGAKLVERADDILEELGPRVSAYLREHGSSAAADAPAADAAEERILAALGHGSLSFDQLMEGAQLPHQEFHAALLRLELRGALAAVAGGGYMRVFGR
ncbi:MAG TPA: DNA-processing protein DprA, partial [Nevskiaceae bacterium]|nr:DNA-processing protein DprA [Nevskiaceae bacterium]